MVQPGVSEVVIDLGLASPQLLEDIQRLLGKHKGSEAIRSTSNHIDEVPERIDHKFLLKVFVAQEMSGNVPQKARQAYAGLIRGYLGNSSNAGCVDQRIPSRLNASCPVCGLNLDVCGHREWRLGDPRNVYDSNVPSIGRDELLALCYEDLRAMHATSANRIWEAIQFMRAIHEQAIGQ